MPGPITAKLVTSATPAALTVAPSSNELVVLLDTTLDGIVAHAGGGQTNAVPLTAKNNRIATVATTGDSVLLPAALAGLTTKVNNGGANNANVFPLPNGDINALAVNTAYAQVPGTQSYTCYTTGKWVTP